MIWQTTVRLVCLEGKMHQSLVPSTAADLVACPGFVDMHVHLAGGGGEAGPSSRTPEARLSALLLGGITTVVGATGTDCVSRSQVRCPVGLSPGWTPRLMASWLLLSMAPPGGLWRRCRPIAALPASCRHPLETCGRRT